jgi:hypothetical protein
MRQSNNKKSRDVTAFLYERLSRDDNLEGESYSIGNQRSSSPKWQRRKVIPTWCISWMMVFQASRWTALVL